MSVVLTAETLHPEGARYAASILCVPGLWAPPSVWRGFASYLAHRGWECHLLDVRPIAGGIDARGAAVAEYAAELSVPAIVLGHDAGGLVALAAAPRRRFAALVLLAPIAPGTRAVRQLVRAPRSLLALVRGRPVPAPRGDAAAAWLDVPAPAAAALGASLAADDASAVRDIAWGRFRPPPAGVPALLVSGDRDRILPPADAAALARAVGAEPRVLEGAGHWPLAGAPWQAAVALVHRWLVQRLGEPLLDLYAEALADREADEEPES